MAPRKKSISEAKRALYDASGRGLIYATDPPSIESTDPPEDEEWYPEDEASLTLTGNQLVAYNIQRARRSRGWTQEYLGLRLSSATGRAWSKASVSAAESSWRGGRARRFDANEIFAFAMVLDVPLAYFFLPPEGDESEPRGRRFLVDVLGEVGVSIFDQAELLAKVDPQGASGEFNDRLNRAYEELGTIDLSVLFRPAKLEASEHELPEAK